MAEARIERHSAVVEQDLPDIYAFIAQHDAVAAERVLDAVEETLRQLAQHPDCRAPYPTRNRKAARITNVSGNWLSKLSGLLPSRH